MILGGQKHAEKLLEKQWGHSESNTVWHGRIVLTIVLFTGSGRVGKLVAGAAAKTLTPTTLEVSPLRRAIAMIYSSADD